MERQIMANFQLYYTICRSTEKEQLKHGTILDTSLNITPKDFLESQII